MTLPWYLADAHSGDCYCDGAIATPPKRTPKHVKHSIFKHKHHKRHNASYNDYNPYSTLSRAQVNRAAQKAIAESRSGIYYCDGILMA